ncbi:MAG TPA: polysaccharide biosynthesis tyrosine autokinase [candidate division Zixibacteria bacterium]|nr:polysaccharide biosynthesis tyrosine autokinase [candidate division Zixibacteria bacterium]
MSKIFEALVKAEEKLKEQQTKPDQPSVRFTPLSLLHPKRHPIKIDFDLDPLLEEQYQKLRRRLAPSPNHPAIKAVMVAATTHGEGATTTSAILASMLARSGRSKILLVDANLRTPALDGVFDGAKFPEGLSDVIVSDKPVDSAIYQTNFSNLFLLPVGRPHSSPSYLFDGNPISKLLETLKERFDFIIFDGAPLDGYSESFFLASKVDGVILVVESERTKKQTVKRIKKELEWGPVNLLGIVLNKKKKYIPELLERFL